MLLGFQNVAKAFCRHSVDKKSTFNLDKVISQTACKSGSHCFVA